MNPTGPMITICLALVLCLAACTSTAPERAYYLLRADDGTDGTPAPAEPDALVGFGRVSVPAYLDRAGLVVQVDAHQVREARYHLWAEPLEQGIRQYLAARISSRLGRELVAGPSGQDAWRYRVELGVEEFHGSLDGEVRLVAQWLLRSGFDDAVVGTGRYSKTLPQTGDGYAGLVEVQLVLLDGLAERIAGVLEELP